MTDIARDEQQPQGAPAATLIIFDRDAGEQTARHLMIQRPSKMRFAADALVFPGGSVDADDAITAANSTICARAGPPLSDAAFRVAAIRETLEEAGVLIAGDANGAPVVDMQDRLRKGAPFSELLREAGGTLDLSRLIPWAEWHAPVGATRRFNTRFYIAEHDQEQVVRCDPDEAALALWSSAADALRDGAEGRAKIILPTLRNLERLAAYADFGSASAHAASTPLRPIMARQETDAEGVAWVCIPDGCGYPITRQRLSELQAA